MQTLLYIVKNYVDFFREVGIEEDFQMMVEEFDKAMDEENFIDRVMKVAGLYEELEEFCSKHRRLIPPTILNNFKADVIDVIETIPLLAP
jgi:hypothetical protein